MCLQILAYVGLVELGISSLLTRDLAASKEDPIRRVDAELLASALRSAGLQMFIGLMLFNAWLFWMPPSWLPELALRPLAVAGNGLLLSIPLRLFIQALVANFDVDFVALITSTVNVLSAAASLVVVRAGLGLFGLACVWGTTQLVLGTIGFIRLTRKYPGILPSSSQVLGAHSAVGRRNMWAVAGQICHTILNATDTLLIGRLLGPASAATYSCTDRALTVASSVPGAATQAVGPFLARANSSDPLRMRAAALGFTLSILCAAGWIAACVTAANGAFVRLWVGPEQFGGVALTALLSLAFVMNQLGGALVQLTFYLGNVRVGTIAGITSSLSFLGLTYFLVPRLGMIAAPLALSISLATTALPSLLFSIWAVTKAFGGHGNLLVGWVVRFALLLGASAAIGSHLSVASVGAFVLGVLFASVLTIVLFGGYLYREPLRSMIRDRILAHRFGKIIAPVLNALEPAAMVSHRPFGRS